MKIAQIAPLVERVPPKKYGGTERVINALTEELVKRGHEVTLFATGDSITTARLDPTYPRTLHEAGFKDIYGMNLPTLLHIGRAYEMQDRFDIIHDHLAPLSLPAANLATTPVLMTMHGPFTPENRRLFEVMQRPSIATISHAQAYHVPGMNLAGTVHNGLSMAHYPFGPEPEGYLLFVGRIAMEKGLHFAIQAALRLDLPLIIAAKLEKTDQTYFAEYVEPFLSERIRWIGEVDEAERNTLMSKAVCMLHPATWREPFGLTLIESMACGCPVIGFNRGSVPEIVKDSETGFVVDDIETMIDAIENIAAIDRAACRAHALREFSASKMADGYELIYEMILRRAT